MVVFNASGAVVYWLVDIDNMDIFICMILAIAIGNNLKLKWDGNT